MAIDTTLLTSLARSEDAARGVIEEFVVPPAVPAGTLGILAQPRGSTAEAGWVICRSIGQEQRHLRRLEAVVARELAGRGLAVLRLRSDPLEAEEARETMSLSARVDEACSAVGALVDRTSVSSVGAAGALFGGTVGALAAQQLDLRLLAMWEPVTNGRRYLRQSFRLQRLSDLVGLTAGVASEREALSELESTGATTIRGFVVTREGFDKAAAVDVCADLKSFSGQALVVAASRTTDADPELERLHAHLQAIGANSSLRVITDPLETPFGEYYYRDVGVVRADTRLALDLEIARVTAEWAVDAAAEAAPEGSLR